MTSAPHRMARLDWTNFTYVPWHFSFLWVLDAARTLHARLQL